MDVDDRLPASYGAPDAYSGRNAEEGGGEPSVIPIQIIRNQRPTFNVVVRTSYRDDQLAQSSFAASTASGTRLSPELFSLANPSGCDDEDDDSISSEPESPVIEVDLTPPPPADSTAQKQLWQSAQQPTESLRNRR
jgi:hypothetical protein